MTVAEIESFVYKPGSVHMVDFIQLSGEFPSLFLKWQMGENGNCDTDTQNPNSKGKETSHVFSQR